MKAQNQRLEALQRAVRQNQQMGDNMQSEEAQLKHLEKDLKAMKTCHKIAARVMAGDKVPPEDLQYLMTHDPEGYKLALAMRKPKADPKEYKSALDKEERGEAQAGQESASASETAESTPAQTSGGTDM